MKVLLVSQAGVTTSHTHQWILYLICIRMRKTALQPGISCVSTKMDVFYSVA